MNFEKLDYNPYFAVGLGGVVVAFIIAFILFGIAGDLKYSPKRATTNLKIPGRFYLVAVALMISSFVTFCVMLVINQVSDGFNEDKATQNLTEKYDIQRVLWDAPETQANPVGVDREDDLLVEAGNGQLYVFKYSVDKESSEPTLKNMPIQGGNTPDNSTTAEALLRK